MKRRHLFGLLAATPLMPSLAVANPMPEAIDLAPVFAGDFDLSLAAWQAKYLQPAMLQLAAAIDADIVAALRA